MLNRAYDLPLGHKKPPLSGGVFVLFLDLFLQPRGQYIDRSMFKDFVSRLDKLVEEKHTGYSVLNVLPKSSLLNKKFDGKNFYSY